MKFGRRKKKMKIKTNAVDHIRFIIYENEANNYNNKTNNNNKTNI